LDEVYSEPPRPATFLAGTARLESRALSKPFDFKARGAL
jgi:hypothetical protein